MKRIVVLDRGFVFIGDIDMIPEDGWITLRNAKCIRHWGTAKGLGQLALEGPQPGTILDETGMLEAPVSSVICIILAMTDNW